MKKVLSSKKVGGFTLIELLVTIAIMLSLLGIAIVSFINISKRKKEESYELVKEQIEVAGEQYFASNEYLFEGFDEGAYGTISVGTLVNEDYLNRVTDPRTGKAIGKCAYVKVTKIGSHFDKEFIDNEDESECSKNSTVEISEPGAPKIDSVLASVVSGGKKTIDDKYFAPAVNFNLSAKTDGQGQIISVGYCNSNAVCVGFQDTNFTGISTITAKVENKIVSANNAGDATTCYKVTNIANKSAMMCGTVVVDNKAPTVTYAFSNSYNSNNWTNNKALTLTFTIKDEHSGVADKHTRYYNGGGANDDATDSKYTWNGTGYASGGNLDATATINGKTGTIAITAGTWGDGIRRTRVKACDKLGNCAYSNEAIAKIDNTAPTCSYNVTAPNASKKVGSWYNIATGEPTVTLSATDTMSKINGTASFKPTVVEAANKNYSQSFKDMAGNSCTASTTVSYDKTAPTLTVTAKKIKNTNTEKDNALIYSNAANNDGVFDASATTWSNKQIVMYANGSDAGSKVKGYSYKKSGATAENTGSVQYVRINADGKSTVVYTVTDNAGNTNTITKNINIDQNPPDCNTITVTGKNNNNTVNGWYNIATGQPTITFTATDVFYEGATKPDSTIHVPSGLSVTSATVKATEGNKSYTQTFTDAAGNSRTCEKIVSYDKTAPTLTVTAKKLVSNFPDTASAKDKYDKYTDGNYTDSSWTNRSIIVYASGTDTISKIKGYNSSITGAKTSTGTSQYVGISADGKSTLKYTVTDNAGNVSDTNTKNIKIDQNPPDCGTITVTGKNNNNTVNGWYNIATGEPTITFTATDVFYEGATKPDSTIHVPSGLSVTSATVKATEGNKSYTQTFTDAAGNSRTCSRTVKYDKTAPNPWDVSVSKDKTETTIKNNSVLVYDKFKCYLTQYNNIKCSGRKHNDGGLSYTTNSCTDALSGTNVDDTLIIWDLSATTSSLKNTDVNIPTEVRLGDYKNIANAFKFTSAKDGEKIIYKRTCIDKAGNRSKYFQVDITSHAQN